MKDSGRITRPFVPEKLEESSTAYPAKDIFASGLQETAGGYIATKNKSITECIPTLDPTLTDTSKEKSKEKDPPPVSLSLNEEELSALKNKHYEEGRQEGLKEADALLSAYKAHIQTILTELTSSLETAINNSTSSRNVLEKDAADAFLLICRRFFDSTLSNDKMRASILDTLLSETLDSFHDRLPMHVTLSISPDDADNFKKLWKERSDVNNVIIINISDSISPGNIALQWPEGCMRINIKDIYRHIETTLEHDYPSLSSSDIVKSD